MKFNEILKTLIIINNTSQKRVGYLTHIPEYKMSKYCCDIQDPSSSDLLSLSNFFGCSVDQLLGKDKYFNRYIECMNYQMNLFDFDLKILNDLCDLKEIYLFDTESYQEVIEVDVLNKKVITPTRQLHFKDYNKVWIEL